MAPATAPRGTPSLSPCCEPTRYQSNGQVKNGRDTHINESAPAAIGTPIRLLVTFSSDTTRLCSGGAERQPTTNTTTGLKAKNNKSKHKQKIGTGRRGRDNKRKKKKQTRRRVCVCVAFLCVAGWKHFALLVAVVAVFHLYRLLLLCSL